MAVRHSWQRVWGCRPLSRVMEAEQESEIKTDLARKDSFVILVQASYFKSGEG